MTITRSIKVFLISMTLTFLMATLPHLGIKALVTPLSKRVDVLEKIKPRLENRLNHFQFNPHPLSDQQTDADFEQASAYAVTDLNSGQLIISKNLSGKLPIASLTKIMTAIVALDLSQVNDKFTVSKNAASQTPTKVMLKPGEKYTLKSLLEFMLISSANDSAQVIKEGIDVKYGLGTFIKAMNLKAQFLGLKDTRFANAEGYDNESHFSSAEDLTILSAYAMTDYPKIAEIVSKESDDLTNGGTDLRFYLNNWNGLLGIYPGASGIKIGNTEKAGNCTIVLSEREGKKLLAVTLGTPGVLERDLWTSQLLDFGFKSFGIEPANITEAELRQKYASWKYF